MAKTNCEMACEILLVTNDGDELSPEHLMLLQDAVNGVLNEKGNQVFPTGNDNRQESQWTRRAAFTRVGRKEPRKQS